MSEKHADTAMTSWLWEHNQTILSQLEKVVEPLSNIVSTHIEIDCARNDSVARETETTWVQKNIPFGVPYTLLPPRLFSELYEDAEPPQLPQDSESAYILVESYRQRCHKPPLLGMPKETYTNPHNDRMRDIFNNVTWMMQQGTTIDPVKWEQYRQVGRELASHGRYDLDIISISRSNSIKGMHCSLPLARLVHSQATNSFENFITMPTAALDVDGQSFGLLPSGYLFMPEGPFGVHFSEKILRVATYMINISQEILPMPAEQLAGEYGDAIAQHTTRGRDGRPLPVSLISMTQEGIRSSMEAIALLTANEVPGYTPDELLDAIVTQGLIEKFTRSLPMGMLGPLLFTGQYFPRLIIHDGNGKLALNPAIMREIKQAKLDKAKEDLAKWTTYWALPGEERKTTLPPVETFLLCPAAKPRGGLSRINKAFLEAYRAFNF